MIKWWIFCVWSTHLSALRWAVPDSAEGRIDISWVLRSNIRNSNRTIGNKDIIKNVPQSRIFQENYANCNKILNLSPFADRFVTIDGYCYSEEGNKYKKQNFEFGHQEKCISVWNYSPSPYRIAVFRSSQKPLTNLEIVTRTRLLCTYSAFSRLRASLSMSMSSHVKNLAKWSDLVDAVAPSSKPSLIIWLNAKSMFARILRKPHKILHAVN